MFIADCNWGTALSCSFLYVTQPFMYLVIGLMHQQLIGLLKWLSGIAEHDFLVAITLIFVIAYVCMTVTIPYTIN